MSSTKVLLHRIALQCSPKRFGRSAVTNSLADLLYTRFEEQGRISDLDEALALYRDALEHRPQGHPERALLLGNIANCLHARAAQCGTLSDLDEALGLYREALKLLPRDHPDRALSLTGVANCLYARCFQLGTSSDLEEALSLHRDALQLRPEGHPDRALSLVNIANCLHVRFDHSGTLSDLDEALALEREALQLRPQGHPDRASSLSSIAQYLHSRFTQLGTLSDLDEALSFEREVLELRPKGHPDRATSLSSIASSLHSRFTQGGELSDIDEALSLEHDALKLRPQGHQERALSLDNIAAYLHARFTQLGTLSDLDEALAFQRSALELRPQGHPYRAESLRNIADSLHTRFKHLGKASDLDDALTLYRDALEQFPHEHPDRAFSLLDITRCLHSRFTHLGTSTDLDEAVVLARDALKLCPKGNPNRSSCLATITQCLYSRFELSNDRHNVEEAFDLYSQLSASQALSLADLECAKQWIQAAEDCQHHTTMLAYQTFLRFSTHRLATLLSLPHDLALLRRLTSPTTADAFSACVRHDDLASAAELLEQGRDIFLGQLFRLPFPLDGVIASGDTGKKLADKFAQLVSLLRTVLNTPLANTDSRNNHVRHLDVELQDVVADIRKLPGCSRFLWPPVFSDLQSAATGGPVIIVNASQYGCDALIVLRDRGPIHVALPIKKFRTSELSLELHSLMSRAKLEDVTEDISVLLRELWDAVVSPIVNVLQAFYPHGSRIWWYPTTKFSLLPLHAAGSYSEGQPNLSDLYISSYTWTLGALIRARHKGSLDPSVERPRFLFVGRAQAPGRNRLISVNDQQATISHCIDSTATLTCVRDQDARVAKITEELDKNAFVHLACHGIADQDHPFKSWFALDDGLLKVEDVARRDLQNAQFAHLSACHVAVGDVGSPDEAVHLAAAMQLAGFRSVIGTIGEVDDAYANQIASRFYSNMVDESGRLDHTRAALALHEAIRGSEMPLDQKICYVHVGV